MHGGALNVIEYGRPDNLFGTPEIEWLKCAFLRRCSAFLSDLAMRN